jgi:hypothetical protein
MYSRQVFLIASCQSGHYLRMTEGYLRMEETSL